MLTQEKLKEILNYDPETGLFKWKERTWLEGKQKTFNVRFSGKIAGSLSNSGYLQIGINNKDYLCHRLAWFYIHGYWPKDYIDHIDRNKTNNKISNLRLATNSENSQNIVKCHPNNKYSKLLGAHYDKRRNLYYSVIVINKKRNWIGWFKTAIEAHNAYVIEKRKIHPFGQL